MEGGVEMELRALLTAAPDVSEWSVSHLICFPSEVRATCAHRVCGSLFARSVLYLGKRERFCPFVKPFIHPAA